jgi:hypothetical protein
LKLWVDDLRPAPDDSWVWSKTSRNTIDTLMFAGIGEITEMSLDHDLGGDDTTRPVVLWMCEHELRWPAKVVVHSANPVGREWLEGMIYRYKPQYPPVTCVCGKTVPEQEAVWGFCSEECLPEDMP